MFDTVINLPPAPDIGQSETIGGDGLTTQLNVSDGGSVGSVFNANSGGEVNVSGGSVGSFFDANSGSEVNISGGSIATGFSADSGSQVNISGGSIDGVFSAGSGSEVNISGGSFGDGFQPAFLGAFGSEVNLVGTAFVLDGVVLGDNLSDEDAFTIVDRDVTLTGRLADGTAFSFNLTSTLPVFEAEDDYFDPDATLTVRLDRDVTLGDGDRDGFTTFLDIPWFVGHLLSGEYSAEADVNQDGEVDFADIPGFIELLQAG